jgi:hypothetical protein
MIDAKTEKLVAVKDSQDLFPFRRRKKKDEPEKSRVSVATIMRWISAGVDGIRLESLLLGHVRYTSEEAVGRFLDAVSAASDGSPIPSPETVKQRATRTARAAKEARALLYPEEKPRGRKPAVAGS